MEENRKRTTVALSVELSFRNSDLIINLSPRTGQISVEQAPGLGDLRGAFNDEDRLQACTERIRIQKYLKEKLLPPY